MGENFGEDGENCAGATGEDIVSKCCFIGYSGTHKLDEDKTQ